jgi:predicted MFS family arabinose efflux permease
VAGAILVPGSLALITSTFSGEQQGRAFGVWASASAATTILGPVIGGLLVDGVSWRAVFFINVPLVAFGLWATTRYVVETRNEGATGRFDWLGAAVAAIAVGGLSFGAIYGQQRDWRDPLAFVVLGAGAVATVALPFLMARRPDPLIPLELFRSRNFSVTNVSTLLIYGALYVFGYFTVLMQQGVLGYTATATGLAGIPAGLILVVLSTRFGALAGRFGPKIFMSVGPALMALGVSWFARVPPTSGPWTFALADPATWFPPTDYQVDFLPGQIIFGVGIAMLVAPLTTALMTSVPVKNSGVASAINNAISRVGPQLAGAVIFVAITASFYSGMAARLPGTDTSDPNFRHNYAPLNPPATSDAQAAEAARQQSTDAFHVAMVVSAGLLVAGALVNVIAISDAVALQAAKREEAAAT